MGEAGRMTHPATAEGIYQGMRPGSSEFNFGSIRPEESYRFVRSAIFDQAWEGRRREPYAWISGGFEYVFVPKRSAV